MYAIALQEKWYFFHVAVALKGIKEKNAKLIANISINRTY